jgi:hypothetical protein
MSSYTLRGHDRKKESRRQSFSIVHRGKSGDFIMILQACGGDSAFLYAVYVYFAAKFCVTLIFSCITALASCRLE